VEAEAETIVRVCSWLCSTLARPHDRRIWQELEKADADVREQQLEGKNEDAFYRIVGAQA
jgi:hypothetical protein